MFYSIFSKFREPVNGLTHLFAALAALGGLVVLLVLARDSLARQGSLLIYGASLVLMLSASAAYHLVKGSPRCLAVLRRIDHIAIYLLIAGTYTPICFNLFVGFWRWGMLVLIWSLALVGIITKIFFINTPRWFTASVYMGMGWLAVLSFQEILAVLPVGALAWLLSGGIAYTFGAVVYITKILDFVPGVFGFHEVWHIFVILGALFHFMVMLLYIAPPLPV
jgi:hemolysin III